jgi:hypothetical protein
MRELSLDARNGLVKLIADAALDEIDSDCN